MAAEAKKDRGDKKIIIDQEICIGCGTCVDMAPKHFKLNDEGKSEVVEQYSEKDDGAIMDAVDSCPVDAISLR